MTPNGFLADLRERFAKLNLELAAEKTRLIEFGRFATQNRKARRLGKPETFQFLGFTHICATTRSGRFMLKRVTIQKRMRAKLRIVKGELMRRRHLPIPEQGKWLGSVVRGHLAYYAVPGNSDAGAAFRTQASRHWYRAHRRRSQRTRLDWRRITATRPDGSHPLTCCIPIPKSVSPFAPKAGAQCVSSARWDLCGGPPEPERPRAVPTAIPDELVERGVRLALESDRPIAREAEASAPLAPAIPSGAER